MPGHINKGKFTQAERNAAMIEMAHIGGRLSGATSIMANAGPANEALTLRELLGARIALDTLINQIAADTRD